MLARLTDETVLARMFAGFEAILTLGVAFGGLLAPLVIDAARPPPRARRRRPPRARWPWPRAGRRCAGSTRAMRVRDADIEILRAVPMLGALPAATIEQLGAGLEHAEFAPRQVVFEQGDRGDRFYVVESGRAEVVRDGRLVNRSSAATGSARSPCSTTGRARPPSARPRTHPCA